MGKNKEVFDAELYAVDQALDTMLRGGRSWGKANSRETKNFLDKMKRVHIWVDSKAAIQRLLHLKLGPGQWLAHRIEKRIEELSIHDINVHIRWVPGHAGVEGNERADRAAKEAAGTGTCPCERFMSLSHLRRLVTERKWKEQDQWLNTEHRKWKPNSRQTYLMFTKNRGTHKTTAETPKASASRFYQLKSSHAFTTDFLNRIRKMGSRNCSHCSQAVTKTVRHLLLECRKRRRDRDVV